MSIILIGLPGVGKTTIGEEFATLLQIPFIDIDALIEEKEGMSCRNIVKEKGLAYFRELESLVIANLTKNECVIATGGGAILSSENRKVLKQLGKVIYLKADPATIQKEFQPFQTIEDRLPLYESLADEIIEV